MKGCDTCRYATNPANEGPCKDCFDVYFDCGGKAYSKYERRLRLEILDEAKNITSNGRKAGEYGKPEDSFQTIARFWSGYLDREIKPADVAVMMILLKVARIKSGTGKKDNWVDIAGYAACGGECEGVNK